jgi:hypothetical protein
MRKKPGPQPLTPDVRLLGRLHVGFTPEVYEEIMFVSGETGLTPSQLLASAWQIAKSELMKPVSIDVEEVTRVHESA